MVRFYLMKPHSDSRIETVEKTLKVSSTTDGVKATISKEYNCYFWWVLALELIWLRWYFSNKQKNVRAQTWVGRTIPGKMFFQGWLAARVAPFC